MINYLPYNDFDIAGIRAALERYTAAGLPASCDDSNAKRGIVTITMLNPTRRDGSYAAFGINKIAHRGWFGSKAYWVVQMYSLADRTSQMVAHGCAYGKTQAVAISNAEWDLRDNFLSLLTFEDAARDD